MTGVPGEARKFRLLARLADHGERALRLLRRDLVQRIADMDKHVMPGCTSSSSAIEISFLTSSERGNGRTRSVSADTIFAGMARHMPGSLKK